MTQINMNSERKEAMSESRTENKKMKNMLSGFAKLDVKKKIQYLAILLIVIVILAIYFASSGKPTTEPTMMNDTTQAAVQSTVGYDSIEEKLKATLSRIEGAGEVEVMITYESSAEIVPAISVDTQTSTTTDTRDSGSSSTNTENRQSQVVTVGGGSEASALVLREDSPVVKGVIVVAKGADNIAVKLNLLNAVQTILNVGPHQVDVYKMTN